jgi:chromosome condensin MukBEF ATPase and DNA-binding subunit MukB
MATTILDAATKLCEVVQNEWKIDALESGRDNHYTLKVHSVGRKYIKLTSKMNTDPEDRIGHAYMFIDKVSGKCYGVKSWNQADKLVRGTVDNFINNPHMCSAYGGFAYLPNR